MENMNSKIIAISVFVLMFTAIAETKELKNVLLKHVKQPMQMLIYKNEETGMERIFISDSKPCSDDEKECTGKYIHIFNINGNYIKSFGEKGEGPQELKIGGAIPFARLTTHNGNITAVTEGKTLTFTSEGEFIKEKTNEDLSLPVFLGENQVSQEYEYFDNYKECLRKLKLFIPNQDQTKILFTTDEEGGCTYPENSFIHKVDNNKLYAVYAPADKKEFKILIYNDVEHKMKKILWRTKPVKVTDEYEIAWEKYYEGLKRASEYLGLLKFNKTFPVIRDMFIENSKIFLLTYPKKNKQKSKCFVFDLNGNPIGKIYLPITTVNPFNNGFLYTIKDDMFYLLEDRGDKTEKEDEDSWYINSFDINKRMEEVKIKGKKISQNWDSKKFEKIIDKVKDFEFTGNKNTYALP
jgi:hypothetical protein